MATVMGARTAREYLRVSKGKGKTARSITDQHRDNLAAEADHGPWAWGEPYKDTGSASKYATRTRDDFEKLLGDLTSGAFGERGDVLVLWEVSRLARETGQGVALIDAAEAGGYLIHVTSLDRTFNPRNYGDRHSLISGINDAEKEARLLSVRTLRGVSSAVGDGRPHGRIPFGYRRTYELIDGRPRAVSQEPDPDEGPLVIELFERVAGWNGRKRESIRAVGLDWERRGIRSREKGVVLTRHNLAQTLKRKAYIGIRVHQGTQWPGSWKPLIERELWDAVQRVLADPARKTYTGTQIKHVLTGVLRCDVCGGKVSLRPGGRAYDGRLVYRCWRRDCFTIDKAQTDRFLIGDAEHPGVLLAYLRRPDVAQALTPDDDTELSAVRTELFRLRGELEELEAAEAPKTARARIRRTNDMEELEADICVLGARLSKLTAPATLARLLPDDPAADLVGWWQAAPVTVQRAVASILLSPSGPLGQPRIRRVADSPSAAVPDRIHWMTG
ncbi:recombinase family protein [Streptomyces sp. NPDC002599]|uniref:recombinase family protein n=1 Tax=Streptomyces sp. NPDC002599 TaxID=3154421 RepID=UPI003332DBB7